MLVPERCDLYPGDLLDGKFKIERSLGEGSFGTVFKARDSRNRSCAIKLLKLWAVPPEVCKNLRDRFTMEFETGRIDCDFLVHSYSYGEVKGNPYIHMEFCPNGDLRSYLERNDADYIRIGRHILYGLSALHSCGKVHRDLKPENVLVRADGTAVLTDFGISGDQNKRMTERGIMGKPQQIFGTYPYMPPEQVNPPRGGQATVLPTTDIFSFGVMMYELICGFLPFGNLDSEADLVTYTTRAKNGTWDKSRLLNKKEGKEWERLIVGCLEPDFKKRLQNSADCIKLLPLSKREYNLPKTKHHLSISI